jgi:hypothetical protein
MVNGFMQHALWDPASFLIYIFTVTSDAQELRPYKFKLKAKILTWISSTNDYCNSQLCYATPKVAMRYVMTTTFCNLIKKVKNYPFLIASSSQVLC